MSEQQTTIEIEDVLSSIRRLVSQDHRRAPAAQAEPVAKAPSVASPVTAAAPMPSGSSAEAPAFVLSEALRIDEPEEKSAVDDLAPQQDEPLTPGAENGDAEQDTASEEGDAVQADSVAPMTGSDIDSHTSEPAVEVAEGQWEQPVGDIFNDNFAAPPAEAIEPRQEAAVAVEPAVVEVATREVANAFDAFAIDDGVSALTATSKTPDQVDTEDLGAELSRLEGSIAEMEAAFSKPTANFEPELGDPFDAAELPESFEAAEWVDADEASFAESDELVLEASEVPEADYHEEVAGAASEAIEPAQVDEVGDGDDARLAGGADVDADLGHEAWAAEAGAMGFTPEDDAERAHEAARALASVHRLHLADAEHHAPAHEPRRTTYEDLRDEASMEPEDMLGQDAPIATNGFDEEALRGLVRDMIRQELQGVLGERITRNVRKLVRREIQRALAAEEFE